MKQNNIKKTSGFYIVDDKNDDCVLTQETIDYITNLRYRLANTPIVHVECDIKKVK